MDIKKNLDSFGFSTRYGKSPQEMEVSGGDIIVEISTEKLGMRVFTLNPGVWSFWEGYDKKLKKSRLTVRRVK